MSAKASLYAGLSMDYREPDRPFRARDRHRLVTFSERKSHLRFCHAGQRLCPALEQTVPRVKDR